MTDAARAEAMRRLGVDACPVCKRFDTGYVDNWQNGAGVRDEHQEEWLRQQGALHLMEEWSHGKMVIRSCEECIAAMRSYRKEPT